MFYKRKSNVLYRDYGAFGFISDNSNFSYQLAGVDVESIGEKILSESGSIFFAALAREPQSIECIAERIHKNFIDIDLSTIINDATEFFSSLEQDGFVFSGATFQECENSDPKFSYKATNYPALKKYSNTQEKSAETTHNYFAEYYKGKPYLTSLHIEISGRCNERCVHCYIPHEMKLNDIDSSLFYNIVDQCKELRLLHLTLSGGEPMLHHDFCAFLKKCRENDFSVNVLTNLTLLNNEILREMKANPLLGVQVSLYSMDATIHDEITQVKNSFVKTMTGIQLLIENDIPMQISCPIMKQNKASYRDVKRWAEKYKIPVGDDFTIIAKYDHSTKNLCNRLSIEEIDEIINFDAIHEQGYLDRIEETIIKRRNLSPEDNICSVCNSSICITETGNAYPCAGWQDYILGNVNINSISEIWNNSEKIKYLRNIKVKDFPKCLSCADKDYCSMCLIRNANESITGNPLDINDFFCKIVQLNKEIAIKHKS